jgi:hypothetical protein
MSTAKMLFQYAMRTADDRFGQVPAGKRWLVTSIVVCNTTSSNHTFRLFHLTPGKSSSTGNALVYDARVSANSTAFPLSGERIPMMENEEMRGQASATGMTITAYGIEEDA